MKSRTKRWYLRLNVVILGLVIFGTLILGQSVFALGLSPAVVKIDGIRNNTSIKKTIYISRAKPAFDERYSIVIEGDAAKYIRVTDTITLPRGKQQVPVNIFIEPVDAPLGEYNVLFRLQPLDAGHSDGVVQIISAIAARIQFSVTDEVRTGLQIVNAFSNSAPFDTLTSLEYTIFNAGNTQANIKKIEVSIENNDKTQTEIISITENLVSINPQDTRTTSSSFEHSLPPGDYKAVLRFWDDAGNSYLKEIPMHISKKERRTLLNGLILFSKESFHETGIIVLGIVVLSLLIITGIALSRQQKK